jgi:hypothetical protein
VARDRPTDNPAPAERIREPYNRLTDRRALGSRAPALWCGALSVLLVTLRASAGGEIQMPTWDPKQPIVVSSVRALRWQEGVHEVLLLDGGLEIRQGTGHVQADRGILWVERASVFDATPNRVIAYLEGVSLCHTVADEEGKGESRSAVRLTAKDWLGRLVSDVAVEYRCRIVEHEPVPRPPLYQRAMVRRDPSKDKDVQLAQFVQTIPGVIAVPQPPLLPAANVPRSIRILPRSNVRIQVSSFPSPDGRERITVIDSGVNIIISGVPTLGTIDIATDRLVIWSSAEVEQLGLSGESVQAGEQPLEFYMEGNIVFRQADRVIYANSMYYDVNRETGVVLDAELLTSVPDYEGVLRLKAALLRQIDRHRFQAHRAAVTSSRLGIPRYWFQTEDLYFEDQQFSLVDPLGGGEGVDPVSGEPLIGHQRLARSRNNSIYVAGVPVFYWPVLNTDFTEPTLYVSQVRFGNDRIFGTQVGADFDMQQLLGISDRFPASTWAGSIDYLSERGVGLGTSVTYQSDQFFGIPGPTWGVFDAWGLPQDQGLDDLGQDRLDIPPETANRGRVLWQHRQYLLNGWQVTGEFGAITDRNFLENYYEREWDEWKDQTTDIEFKRLIESMSWNLFAQVRLNSFFTETERYPQLDHFVLGQSWLEDRLTWYGRSLVSYARMLVASEPEDPQDAGNWNPLPWEANVEGLRVGARHELDLPLELGAVKVVPYVLGELMHWGETLVDDDVTRAHGQAGLRASLPMWRVDPTVRSQLLNLSGLAHKVVFETELLWADANYDLDDLPLYDELNDNSTEHFLRRFVDSTFGGMPDVDDTVPERFDERFYAARTGMQSWVTAKSLEVAEDLALVRLEANQRWQTKRGPPHAQRVVDWMTFDTEATFFPDPDRDNFGASIGLINYDWRWHVGDRVTIMSDGFADVFADGMRSVNLGGYISRPERGSAFLGLRSTEGPISVALINAAFNYRMTPKWIATTGAQVDLGNSGNIVQVYELTRVGESFLVSLSANSNRGRDNVGFGFAIQPRFLPLGYRGIVGGVPVLPAGTLGIE